MKKIIVLALLAGSLVIPSMASAQIAQPYGVVNPQMHGICAYFVQCDPWKITDEQYDAYFNFRANGVVINQDLVIKATQIRLMKDQLKVLVLQRTLNELKSYGINVTALEAK